MEETKFTGQCFCGAVQLTVTGSPEAAGYCHCTSCRSWAAAPVNAFTLWRPENVKVSKGEENLGEFHKSENSLRKFCRICGGHVMTAHPAWNLIDVYAGVIPGFPFEPKVHVHYAETVLPMSDGLPKFKDIPSEMGGSGEMVGLP